MKSKDIRALLDKSMQASGCSHYKFDKSIIPKFNKPIIPLRFRRSIKDQKKIDCIFASK